MNKSIFIIVYLVSVFIASITQIILKKSTFIKYDNPIKEYINFRVLFSYSLFFLCTLLTVWAYKGIPLSLGPVLESSGYIYVTVLSYFFLNESISRRKIMGNFLIILGICLFNLAI